jgi:hypothetical protein
MPEQAHNRREHQLCWEGHRKDDDHPPPDEFRPHAEGDIESAEEGDQTDAELACFL